MNAVQRFAAARVARLATIRPDGAPRLVPITFVADGSTIHTPVDHKPKSTARLRRLDDVARDPRVSVLVDHYEDDWARLWWVRADGTASVLGADTDAHAEAARRLAEKYADYRGHPITEPVITIAVERWSSWESRASG